MMFATLDDLEGSVEMLVFGKALDGVRGRRSAVDEVVLVRGRVDHRRQGHVADRAGGRAFEPTPEEVEAARGGRGARAGRRRSRCT